jgi:opacity protein-like surface antigen
MRKPVLFTTLAAMITIAALPSEARAQQTLLKPLQGKLVVSANVGIQVGDNDLSRQVTFPLYDETATLDISQTINNGAFFEFGGAYKVRPDFGVGMTYSFLGNSGEGNVSGSLPHPLLFEQPRTFSQDVSDITHSEQALHFQAVYYMPFIEKVDFAFSGGPSIFIVKQGLIRGITFTDLPPNGDSVRIDSVDVVEPRDSGWGFNLGAEVIYAFTPNIGLGALLRYTHGSVEFNPAEGQTADVSAGGFQIGGGVRYRF